MARLSNESGGLDFNSGNERGDVAVTFVETTPTGDVGRPANIVHFGLHVGQADGDDVGLESDRIVEPEEGEIVFKRAGVELRMRRHDLDLAFDVRVLFLVGGQVVFAHP